MNKSSYLVVNCCHKFRLFVYLSFLSVLVLWTKPISQEAWGHSDLLSSIENVTKQIKRNETDVELYVRRGELHRRHADWEAALNDYASAQRHGIDPQRLMFFRGRMHFEAGQYETALDHLNKLLARKPDSVDALIVRAKIPIQKPLDAVKDLDRALELLESPSPDLFLDRAKLLAGAGPHYFNQLIEGINEGVARLGPLVSLITLGVDQCEQQNQYNRALELMDQLPKQIQRQANWQTRRGKMFLLLNNPSKAHEHYRAAHNTIEALPASRRHTRAMKELENEIRVVLEKEIR